MSVSLDKIVDVVVEVSQTGAISSDFNLGLIIGDSEVLTAQNRVKIYTRDSYATEMVTDGFTTSDPEYTAAVAYFSQNPAPQRLAIGVKLESETSLQALNATRNALETFYAFCFCYDVQNSDVTDIASAVEAFSNPTMWIWPTADATMLVTGSSNTAATLKEANISRTMVFYTTQDNASAALLGTFCGLNSMQPGSAYTLAYKTLTGVTPDDLTTAQMNAIQSYNANAYTIFGRRYSFFYPGLMPNGTHADQLYFVDIATYLIQQYVVAGLVSKRVVPQTESGLSEILSFATNACEELASIGFVATGIWTGSPVMDLNTGDAVPGGYYIQSGSLADQSPADREARKSPPLYICLKSAGAIENVLVQVYVNQ